MTLKSLTYYVLIAVLVFFYGTQMGSFAELNKSVEGREETYGTKPSEDKNKVMEVTLAMLADDYEYNEYKAYPVGFYKKVILNEKKQEKIHQILRECTGLEEGYADAVQQTVHPETADAALVVMAGAGEGRLAAAPSLTYERFLELMGQVDELLGGGSDYDPETVEGNAVDPLTYEEAMAAYEMTLNTDRITRGYARLFCDYMGIVLSLLPVFLAVTRGIRDRRAQVSEVIYIRKVSSAAVVLSRYLAAVVMIGIPVLLLSIMPLFQCIYFGKPLGGAGEWMFWRLSNISAVGCSPQLRL